MFNTENAHADFPNKCLGSKHCGYFQMPDSNTIDKIELTLQGTLFSHPCEKYVSGDPSLRAGHGRDVEKWVLGIFHLTLRCYTTKKTHKHYNLLDHIFDHMCVLDL